MVVKIKVPVSFDKTTELSLNIAFFIHSFAEDVVFWLFAITILVLLAVGEFLRVLTIGIRMMDFPIRQ